MKTSHLIVYVAALAISTGSFTVAASPSSNVAREEKKVFKLRPSDQVSVHVFRQPSLGIKDGVVDTQGELRLGGISDPIHVAGLSVAEAQTAIQSRYEKSGIVSPRVTVLITKFAPR